MTSRYGRRWKSRHRSTEFWRMRWEEIGECRRLWLMSLFKILTLTDTTEEEKWSHSSPLHQVYLKNNFLYPTYGEFLLFYILYTTDFKKNFTVSPSTGHYSTEPLVKLNFNFSMRRRVQGVISGLWCCWIRSQLRVSTLLIGCQLSQQHQRKPISCQWINTF